MSKSEKEILDKALNQPSEGEQISRMIADQEESFPSVSEITLDEPYVDPFAIPKWCNTKDFAYAWIDLKDDIQRYRAMEVGYFRIVNRSSSCISSKVTERDFRDHGAVERQGMVLVFRPKDLDDKMRTRAVSLHGDIVEGVSAGKQADGYEVTHMKYNESQGRPTADSAKLDVVAYEEAGEVGIKKA
jgi:hypothetical protein